MCNDCGVALRQTRRILNPSGWLCPPWLMALTANRVVLDAEELGLVVARDCGVRIHITGQHGQLSGEILRLHVLFLSIEGFTIRDIWLPSYLF